MAFLLATNSLVAQAAAFISSADIINNTIKSGDVKNNSLKGKDIKDNKLTGADIKEATLSGVNAATLNGQPASSYLNTTYTFTLPVTPASTNKVFSAAVPAGTYLVSYNVIATGASPRCAVLPRTDVGTTGYGFQDGFGNGGFFMSSSSTVVTVPAGQTPALWCFGASFSLYPGADGTSSLSFTKMDTRVSGAATGGREAPAVKPGNLH